MTDEDGLSATLSAAIDVDRDLVQLLTPEGERVEHPDYAFDRRRRADQEPLPRHGADPPDRRRGDRAAAAGRARHLGLAAGPGGRADRLRPGDAAAGLRLPHLPRARRRLVPRRRPAAAARPVPRRRPRRLGPGASTGFHLYTIVIGAQTLHATGYAMGIERDGCVGTGDPERDAAVIGYFGDGATSQGDVNEAFVFASVVQRAGRLLLPEQPVGDLRADRAAVPDPAVPAGGRLRLPRRTGRRQRRAGRARGHHARRWSGPARAAARR